MSNEIEQELENLDIKPGVIEKFIQELPEKALRLGVRVLLAVLCFLIGMQLIKLVRRILKKIPSPGARGYRCDPVSGFPH